MEPDDPSSNRRDDASTDDSPVEDSSADDAPTEDASAEDASTDGSPEPRPDAVAAARADRPGPEGVDDRYAALHLTDAVVVYDRGNPQAWIQSTAATERTGGAETER